MIDADFSAFSARTLREGFASVRVNLAPSESKLGSLDPTGSTSVVKTNGPVC